MTAFRSLNQSRKRGLVLVLVLVVVAMLSLAGFSFTDLMMTEVKASRSVGQELQARQLVASGLAYLQSLMDQPPSEVESFGGWYDNPTRLRGVEVFMDERAGLTGRFTVLVPLEQVPGQETGEGATVRFGLDDESARLNLLALVDWDRAQPGAGRRALLQLPGMTAAQADALLDWCDADSNPREQGAEVDYYAGLEPSYGPRNAPVDTLSELLMVRDVRPEQLFGRDTNRNGTLDPRESSAEAELPMDRGAAGESSSVALSPQGWSSLLTLSSAEANVDTQGNPRINLNDTELKRLHEALVKRLDQRTADFVILFRQFGPATSSPKPGQVNQVDLSQPARFSFTTLFDAAGVKIVAKTPSEPAGVLVESPLGLATDAVRRWLPGWLDAVTIVAAPRIAGRVNVNLAAREVLLGLPGLETTEVDNLLAKRRNSQGEAGQTPELARRTAAWLVTEGVISFDKFRKLNDYVTGGGAVFRTQIVGFFDEVPLTARAEIVFDASQQPLRVVAWQDLQATGRAFEPAVYRGEEGARNAALSGR